MLRELPPKFTGREKLSQIKNFVEIGGNRSITTAKIILFGERHRDKSHEQLIGSFIRTFAHKGDIVLFEGVEKGQELIRGQSSKIKDYQIPESVRAFGWDNLSLYLQSLKLYLESAQIIDDMKAARDAKEYDKVDQLYEQHTKLHETIDEVSLFGRNESLIDSITLTGQQFPSRRIFVIAGREHLTKDSHLEEALRNQPYVMLRPDTPEPGREEKYATSRRHIQKIAKNFQDELAA